MISRTDWSGETPATVFFLYDGNCNVDAVVDEDGALVKQFTYDVFGAVRETLVGSGAETVGFSGGIGHITDLENSLVYMRARYYDPSIGRFISEDPGHSGANSYMYCGNNPVNMVDQSGRFSVSSAEVINWVAGMGGWTMAALHLTAVGTALSLLGAYVGALATNMALANIYQSPFLTMRAGMMARDSALLSIAGVMCGLAALVCGVLGELDDPDAAGYVADYLTTAGSLLESD